LRISGKRLRYAIELFDQCWKSSTLPTAKRIARLQTALGDVHDCDVWIESFGKQLTKARKELELKELEALVWLLNHFMKVRVSHLRDALTLWNSWQRENISATLIDAIKN